jgi:protein TonB
MELKKTSKMDLQNKKTLFLEIGLGLSLLIVLVAFNLSTRERSSSLLIAGHQEIIEEEERVPITQEEQPRPSAIPRIPQIPDMIDIVEDDVNILSNVDFSEWEKDSFVPNFEQYAPVLKPVEEVDEPIPFAVVEDKPKFQGKDASEFVKWINSHLANNYPQAAIDNNLQGVVRVSFTVNIDGTLSDVKSLKKADPILEECVIELVKKSPKWTAGRQQNKPVKVTYQIPVVFRLR